MKKLTTLLLLLSLLLSVLASCQGTVPTGSLPQSRGTAPLTEGKKTEPKQTTEQKETVPQTKTEEQAVSTEEPEMTLDQAKRILEKQLDAPQKKSDGSYEYLVREELAQAILLVNSKDLDHFQGGWGRASGTNEPYGKVLRHYFERLEKLVVETKCKIVFQDTVTFKEENGAYYVSVGQSSSPNTLYYFSDRGVTKEYSSPKELDDCAPYAFANNSTLETITLNGRYYVLGDYAFLNCPSLKTVNIPENEISQYHEYDPDTAYSRSVPALFAEPFGYAEGVDVFDKEWAIETFNEFQGYYERSVLTNNIVDENPANFVVKNGVLLAYVGLGGHVVIPEGVTEIRGGVFDHRRINILSVSFPSTLKKICTWAFRKISIPLVYELPANLEEIEEDAFGCGSFQPYFLVTGIPEDCRVAEGAFPLDWMESYGRTHQELPKELKNAQKPNA